MANGVQQVLVLAATDAAFRERLLADRAAALDSCDLELTDVDRAVLMAAQQDQLAQMIERIVPTDPARREFLFDTARTAGAIAAAALLAGPGCDAWRGTSKGIRPEREQPREAEPDADAADADTDTKPEE